MSNRAVFVIRGIPWRCLWCRPDTRHNYAVQVSRCRSRPGVHKVETPCWLHCPCTPCTSSRHADADSPPAQPHTPVCFHLHRVRKNNNNYHCCCCYRYYYFRYLPRDAMRKSGLCCRPVSVSLSVWHVGALYPHGWRYCKSSFSAR